MNVSRQTARRYLLGRLGLWPGRRWAGQAGAAAAIHELGALQVDPLQVVARNHDLMLWSRVQSYAPEQLDALLYRERRFFDYGGILFVYPIEELPYWRPHMRQRREDAWRSDIDKQTDLLEEVRAALRERGPLGHRDFAGHARVNSYRARTAAGLALFYLWLTGELMTHSRRRFERLYAFREHVAPPQLDWAASDAEAQEFHARKALRTMVFVTPRLLASRLSYCLHRKITPDEAGRWLAAREAEDQVAAVTIDDVPAPHRGPFLVPRDHPPLLEELERGGVPAAWRPLASTTEDEVTLVAPLDPALDRARTRALFDFEYVWEVYKPAAQRRWGYYTMPILWGDRYVGRIDPKLDRKAGALVLNGLWLEDEGLAADAQFAPALARGLTHLAHFLGARTIDVEAVQPPDLRRRLQRELDVGA